MTSGDDLLQRGLTREFFNDLGVLLKRMGRLDAAVAAYEQAIARDPVFVDALYNLGNAFREKGELESAVRCFQQALESDPGHGHSAAALAQVLCALRRSEEAIRFFEDASRIMSDDCELLCDWGDALLASGLAEQAFGKYQEALRQNAHLARAWYSAGNAQNSRKEYASAAACFQRALQILPDWFQARHNLGRALFELGQVDEALRCFEQANAEGQSQPSAAMLALIIPQTPSSGNRVIFESRREWATCHFPAPDKPPQRVSHRTRNRLRVGFLSSFFSRENWMKPVWGLINSHDRNRLEIHLFSDAPASAIKHGYSRFDQDHFYDISALTNEKLANTIRDSQIDLLIDLNGYSNMRRLPVLASKPAPVLAGWFNIYATTGIASYDFLIGDNEVIPPEEEQFYCEKIRRVYGSYLTFQVNYPVPAVTAPPCLQNGAVRFGCLAPQYKITPNVVAVWCEILQNAPGASLFLKNTCLGSSQNQEFVRSLFATHNIDTRRLIFEGPSPHYEFLEAYSKIDIALDTFPYNGGTTTTEAIWQGVPVITFKGDRWVSRTSTSLLCAGNLGEFVCSDVKGYVELATRLATSGQPGKYLNELRQNMRTRLEDSAVCRVEQFAREMEKIYFEIARRL